MALTQVSDAGLKTPASDLQDNEKIILGTGNDLEIYHDGTHNQLIASSGYIKLEATTNDLYLRGNTVWIQSGDGNETFAKLIDNGSVELYYDDSKKLSTDSAGIVLTDHMYIVDTKKAIFGDGSDLQIYHNGSHSYIDSDLAGAQILIRTKESGGTTNNAAKFMPTGAVELYYDGTKKLSTLSNGIEVLGSEGEDGVIYISADEGDDNADKWKLGADSTGYWFLENYTSGSWETNIKTTGNGGVELYYDNAKKVETAAEGMKVTGTSGTNIVIGNTTNSSISKISYNQGGSMGIRCDTDNNASSPHIYFDISASRKWNMDENGWLDNDADTGGIKLGAHQDLEIYHNGSDSYIDETGTGDLKIRSASGIQLQNGSEKYLTCHPNGAVKLYDDDTLKFETTGSGSRSYNEFDILGAEGTSANLYLRADEGDDNGDGWRIGSNQDDNDLTFANNISGSYVDKLTIRNDAMTMLGWTGTPHNNSCTFDVRSSHASNCHMSNSDSSNGYANIILGNAYAAGGTNAPMISFRDGSGNERGSIKISTNSSTAYNTSSDYRLKEKQSDITDGITRLKTLKPYKFKWKSTGKINDGFFAHEAGAIVPEALDGEKDAVVTQAMIDKNLFEEKQKDEIIPQSLDYAKFVPLLTAALKEAVTKIETLETKVAALEAK